MKRKRLIITGGGTGGHILAGVAIAQEWKKVYSDSEIIFVGAYGGLEEKIVPRYHQSLAMELKLLRVGKLNRLPLLTKFKTLLGLPFAFLKSFWILISFRPDVVIGVGGYASGPFLLVTSLLSWLTWTKTAILEQNAVPGITNRILGRLVQNIFCAFPGSERHFSKKVVVTGNPIRNEIRHLDAASLNPFTVFIFGGSQGARGINDLVLESLSEFSDLSASPRFIHQTGENDFERVEKAYAAAGAQAEVQPFIFDMKRAYSEASLLICRAGASTLSEISAVGRASILIPLPTAADDHQSKNASVFGEIGAAEVFPQAGASGKDLASLIRQMIENPQQIEQMATQAKSLSKPDAAAELVAALTR